MSCYNVPLEVWEEIFSYVNCSKTLASVSLSSKTLHSSAEKYLYRTLDFSNDRGPAISALLRTISLRPELARYVESLIIFTPDTYMDDCDLGEFDLSLLEDKENDHTRDWIREKLQDSIYGTPFCDNWYSEIFGGENGDATAAMLLVVFSRTLKYYKQLNAAYSFGGPYLERVLAFMRSSQLEDQIPSSCLAKLENVHQDFTDSIEYKKSLYFALPFLKLKSVKCYQCTDVDFASPFRQQNFTQTSLILERALLRPCVYESFLQCFRNLKHFSCEFVRGLDTYAYDNQDGDEDVYGLSGRAAVEGLMHSSTCLEELNLTMTEYEGVLGNGPIQTLWGLQSFTRFENLRSLGVDAYFLFTDNGFDLEALFNRPPLCDRLPPSLQHLTIYNCDDFPIDYAEQIFHPRQWRAPSLKTLSLKRRHLLVYPTYVLELESLQQLAATNGVELTIS